jgi:magnesium-transporting ATPase (P-type)
MTADTDRPSLPSFPHALPVADLVVAIETNIENGLSEDEARRRWERFGANRITEETGSGRWALLIRQFSDVLVLILLAAALISGLFLGDWLEAGVIVAIVLINAAIGFVQEVKAADAAEGLRRLNGVRTG